MHLPPTRALLASTLFLTALIPASAATHHVKIGATGLADGTTWENAFPTLQDALSAANPNDEIWVAQGVYYPDEGGGATNDDFNESFVIPSEVSIYGGFGGSEASLSQRRPAFYLTILSGDIDQNDTDLDENKIAETPADLMGNNSRHVVTSTAATAVSIFEGFIITAGNANASGGGMLLTGAHPTVRNCRFHGNYAEANGGAIALSGSNSTFANCLIAGNACVTEGGGISALDASEPTFINCALRGNSAAFGGGLRIIGGAGSLINCSFSGNYGTSSGGAIRASVATCQFINLVIWNNRSGASTASTQASLDLSGPNTISYNQCLLQNYTAAFLNGSGGGNLNGTVPSNNPLFADPPDPSLAPHDAGDLRLTDGSPAIEKGDNGPNPETRDLADRLRVTDGDHSAPAQIDLGAYELPRLWYVDDTAAGADGLTWPTAFLCLQDALATAAAGDEIRVAKGVYWPDRDLSGANDSDDPAATFQLLADVALIGGYKNGGGVLNPTMFLTILSGDIDGNDVNTDGNDIAETTADIAGTNSYTIINATGSGTQARIDGFIITAGSATLGSGSSWVPDNAGGAVFTDDASPRFATCSFSGNACHAYGAAVFARGIATLPFLDCSFTGNVSAFTGGGIELFDDDTIGGMRGCTLSDNESNDGGAVRLRANSSYSAINSTFSGNEAVNGGGAINLDGGANNILFLSGCAFETNTAATGGAIENRSLNNYIINCTFSSNHGGNGTSGSGGAIYSTLSFPVIIDCTFTANTADNSGGAIHKTGTGSTGDGSITNCLFEANSSALTAGALSWSGNFSTLTITDCEFNNNTTASNGGAISVSAALALNLTDCDFTGNSVSTVIGGFGGAIYYSGTSVIATGCNFTTNTSQYHGGAIANNGFTNLLDLTDCTFTGNTATDRGGAIIQNLSHPMNITNCTFTSNGATKGGAILSTNNSTVTINDCAFDGNTAVEGGAIHNNTVSAYPINNCTFDSNIASSQGGAYFGLTSSADFTGCTFSDNTAALYGGAITFQNMAGGSLSGCNFTDNSSGSRGGAVYTTNGANPAVTSCSFLTNSALNWGGAVTNWGGDPTFFDCTFKGNTVSSGHGGAIANTFGSQTSYTNCTIIANSATSDGGGIQHVGSLATYTNCMIAGNSAGSGGGGVYFNLPGSPVNKFVFINCSISGNSAATQGGGGIFVEGVASSPSTNEIINTIIWNNDFGGTTTVPSSSLDFIGVPPIDYKQSLIEHYDLTGVGTANLDGTSYAGAPHFQLPFVASAAPSTLGNLGLIDFSPTVDNGDNAANSEPNDLAGAPRIAGGTIDLGAFEGSLPLVDTDSDCLPDVWELAFTDPPSTSSLLPNSDLDNDGLNAVSEFTLGLSPNSHNPQGDYLIAGNTTIGVDDFLTLTFPLNPASGPFVTFDVEQSDDLGQTDPWSETDSTFLSNTGIWTTFRTVDPISSGVTQFLRLEIK